MENMQQTNNNENYKFIIEESRKTQQLPKVLSQRAKSQIERNRIKMEHIKEELEEKEMKECTFLPKTLRHKEKRRFNDFLQDQEKYIKKRKENLSKMIEDSKIKEEQSLVLVPKINDQSRTLTEIKNEQPVHERLFSKSKKTSIKPEERIEKKRIRRKDIKEFSLYEDAKKRQERFAERIKKEDERFMSNRQTKEHYKNPYVKQKFEKEFNIVLESVGGLKDNGLLTYEQMSIF